MRMTEQEAREKWCPFVRLQDEPRGAGINVNPDDNTKDSLVNIGTRCIASDCAAWRWATQSRVEVRGQDGEFHGGFRDATGFCGLAGKP